jgi:hypothetical protein
VAAGAHRAGRQRDGPAGKLIALSYLLISVQRGSVRPPRPDRLYRLVEIIGRWSMLDVFVDTFTVALIQLQPLMSVGPGGRALLRGGGGADDDRGPVVRPRLIWDAGAQNSMADDTDRLECREPPLCRAPCGVSVVWVIRSLARWSPSVSRCSGS